MHEMNKESIVAWCKDIIDIVSEHLLLEGQARIIVPGSEHVSEIYVLYAKQTNLFESLLVLLENGHAEEAVIIFRSMLNNGMLINYLSHGDVQKRYQDYKAQPIKAAIKKLNNYKLVLRNNWFENTEVTNPMTREEVNLKIENFKTDLINLGLIDGKGNADTRLLTIRNLALVDVTLFGMYAEYYDLASKYEHSDISSLGVYKKPIEGTTIDQAYILTLASTDIELDRQLLNLAISIYGLTFIKILEFLQAEYEHMISENSKPALALLMMQLDDFISNIKAH
ncbi:DUF5677 domain-containing protein [Sporosarcina obsidiansis]|uniref:DUF5677 domain-containing protein n=1 Tax=Sporosarcina obsidiansis TaxID=2660748 RepID=UPI00129A559E|nr:DUF5677 domain-containing protein [Sporosarcina obsidiansis]